MRICVIGGFDDLRSLNTGASIRIFNLAKTLGSMGHEIIVVIPTKLSGYTWVKGVTLVGVTGLFPRRILGLISKLLGVAKASSLYIFDPTFLLMSRHIITNSNVVQVEGASTSTLLTILIAKIFKKPVVLDCHDVFQPLQVEYKNELRRIFEMCFERLNYKYSDYVITVSEKDKNYLIRQGVNEDKIGVVPNGVDTSIFNKSKGSRNSQIDDNKGNLKVIFVGNMEYLPNENAAKIITSKIGPKVLQHIREVEFLLVGRIPLNTVEGSTNITFTGVVENVAEYLAASDVAIAPLIQGSGTRLKILEYFSCGLPVVSTTKGAEGLEVSNNVNILIEDDMNDFSMKIVHLLNDGELREKIGSSARKLVIEKYDWATMGKKLDAIHSQLYLEKF